MSSLVRGSKREVTYFLSDGPTRRSVAPARSRTVLLHRHGSCPAPRPVGMLRAGRAVRPCQREGNGRASAPKLLIVPPQHSPAPTPSSPEEKPSSEEMISCTIYSSSFSSTNPLFHGSGALPKSACAGAHCRCGVQMEELSASMPSSQTRERRAASAADSPEPWRDNTADGPVQEPGPCTPPETPAGSRPGHRAGRLTAGVDRRCVRRPVPRGPRRGRADGRTPSGQGSPITGCAAGPAASTASPEVDPCLILHTVAVAAGETPIGSCRMLCNGSALNCRFSSVQGWRPADTAFRSIDVAMAQS